jgi:hypothetical protein
MIPEPSSILIDVRSARILKQPKPLHEQDTLEGVHTATIFWQNSINVVAEYLADTTHVVTSQRQGGKDKGMRTKRIVLLTSAALCLATAQAPAQGKAQASFDRLKTLSGEWEGTAGNNQAASVSYRVVSNGSALEETLHVGKDETMITVYHLDGDRLMVTHYCAAGNQPRMVATPDPNNPNMFAFKFLDATNMSGPDAGHMRDLVVTLLDRDHFTQQWTWREKAKEDKRELFKLTRKK